MYVLANEALGNLRPKRFLIYKVGYPNIKSVLSYNLLVYSYMISQDLRMTE